MPDAATAASSSPLPESLRFGRFELQPRERRLLVDGRPANLGGRAFDLLVALVARPGRLVTKNELLDLAWPGLVVEENNLATQVSSLRKVLGAEIIATIPGRGYRFTAALDADAARTEAAPPLHAAPPSDARATAGMAPGNLPARAGDADRTRDRSRHGPCLGG